MTIVLLMYSPSPYEVSYPVGAYSDDDKAMLAAVAFVTPAQFLLPWAEFQAAEGFPPFWQAEVHTLHPDGVTSDEGAYYWLQHMEMV